MKWCELREYKWNEYVTIAVNRNLSNCEIARKKVFRGFHGIRTRGLCVSAAVLYQPELWRPIHWEPANLLSSSTRVRNETQNEMMWTAGIQMKWICDHRSESQFKQLRNSPKKRFFGASTGFEPVASALALQCSTSLSYEDPYTESRPILIGRLSVYGLFFGLFRNCLNCDSLRWSHIHFICIPAVHIISFCITETSTCLFLRMASLEWFETRTMWVFFKILTWNNRQKLIMVWRSPFILITS